MQLCLFRPITTSIRRLHWYGSVRFSLLLRDASLWILISPGIEIHRVIDVAFKSAVVNPEVQFFEHPYGLLEIYFTNQGEVKTIKKQF